MESVGVVVAECAMTTLFLTKNRAKICDILRFPLPCRHVMIILRIRKYP